MIELLILDIDGTLADISHREHLIERDNPDWDEFNNPDLVALDDPIPEALEALLDLLSEVSEVVLLTGRPESLRSTTIDWLEEHFDLVIGEETEGALVSDLIMRPDDEIIEAPIFKKSVIEEDIIPIYEEFVAVDDNDDVIAALEEFGEVYKAPDFWEEISS